MATKAYVDFLDLHYQNPQGLRLGQRFYNFYIKKDSWPEMFYGKDEDTRHLIQKWLNDHHYFDELPAIVKDANDGQQ